MGREGLDNFAGTLPHHDVNWRYNRDTEGGSVVGRKIIEDKQGMLVKSLVGHTVVAAEFYDAYPNYEWTEHERAKLTLDDGRVIYFGGWGYDAYGAVVWEEDDNH